MPPSLFYTSVPQRKKYLEINGLGLSFARNNTRSLKFSAVFTWNDERSKTSENDGYTPRAWYTTVFFFIIFVCYGETTERVAVPCTRWLLTSQASFRS